MADTNVLPLPKSATKPRRVAAKPAKPDAGPKPSSTRRRLAGASATSIGLVAVGATALSLSDLADSIQEVAHVAVWKAYALATALDLNFVSTEAFSLFATAAIVRETRHATAVTKILTLGMSGIANAYAMAHTAENWILQLSCVAAGFAVPSLIALATYTLGKAVRS